MWCIAALTQEYRQRMYHLLATTCRKARCLNLVLDNLNAHFATSFVDVLSERQAEKLLRRVQFHYTPKHASWLNVAEIEIGVLARQCLNTRFDARDTPERDVRDWEQRRNRQRRTIEWRVDIHQADRGCQAWSSPCVLIYELQYQPPPRK